MNAYIHTMTATDENGEKSILYPRTKQEAVEGLEERVAKLEVADIAEAEDTTLENSNAGRLKINEIGGVMEQVANPSPTNPQEIRKSVVSGIRTHGKNFINQPCVPADSAEKHFLKAGTYTVTRETSENGNNWYFGAYDSENNFITQSALVISDFANSSTGEYKYGGSSYKNITFTINTDCYIRIGSLKGSGNTYLMLEEGTEATEYEPYTESVITFSKPIELGNVGEYKDVIGAKNIIRRIGKYTVTSSDLISSNAGYMTIGIPNVKAYGQSGVDLYDVLAMSNYFRSGSWGNTLDESVFPYWNTSRISFKTAMTIEEFRTFVAEKEAEGKPLEVYFVLAEETTEELPIADQIALNSLLTFAGITHVEFISEIKPTFSAKYGTTEMGGMTLESLLTARNNDLRISAVESAVINNI